MAKKVRHAAGYVLWRRTLVGHEYLILRNAQHATWGFPKGHRDPGERDEECARRELEEETGLTDVSVDFEFDQTVSYLVSTSTDSSVQKKVRYFLAELLTGEFNRSSEHDEGGWFGYTDGRELFQHELSKEILDEAESRIAEILKR